MKHYSVIVVGGGTMGSAAAWALAKRGERALVLEQFSHVHSFGSHGGKTRIIRHAYAESPEYVPLVQRAHELWRDLEAESGETILCRTGGIELAAPGFGHAQSVRASAEAFDLPYEWLPSAEVRHRWPAWNVPDDWDACYTPQAGFLLTEPAIRALGAAAGRLGAEIHAEEPVDDWGTSGDTVWVRTAKDTYHGDRLIVTAGAWARQVLAALGLPLTVLRKVLWWFAVEDPTLYASERFPVFITESSAGSIYGFPIYEHAGLKIALHSGGTPVTPETVDRTAADDEKMEVLPFAQRMLRGVTDRVLESAVCLYTMTPDTDFVIDRHPEWPHVVIGAGFSGHGFKFATGIGELLADLALDAGAATLPRVSLTRLTAPVESA